MPFHGRSSSVQTFIPHDTIIESAYVLDDRRLGKQRVETLQIMNALSGRSKGWVNHPAVRMWRGYEAALMWYQIAICNEWQRRGFEDTCLEKTLAVWTEHFDPEPGDYYPAWWGQPQLHASHRSNLLRKDPDHYRRFWPDEADDLPYVWPV